MSILARNDDERCAVAGCVRRAWDGCRPAEVSLCEPHYVIPSNRVARMRALGLIEEGNVSDRPTCAVCGKGSVPDNPTPSKLGLCWRCYADKAKRDARREALDLPSRRRQVRRTSPPAEIERAALAPEMVPVQAMRSELTRMIRQGVGRFVAQELRAIADEMERGE